MSKKRISQETFDETVKENMEEFDMSREEAVKDAIKQFTSQGVELSNICLSVNECDDHHKDEVSTSYNKIKECLELGEGAWNREELLSALADLDRRCREGSSEQILIAKTCLYSKLAVNTLMDLLSAKDVQIPYKALTTLQAICWSDENNRDSVSYESMSKLSSAIKAHGDDPTYVKYAMGLVKVICMKTENNKVNFVKYGGLDLMKEALQNFPTVPAVVCETCAAIRAVTAVDDFRKDFSSGHTNTRTFVSKGGIPLLMSSITRFEDNESIVSSGLAAIKNIANTEESVNIIVANKGLDVTTAALRRFMDNVVVARTAISVFRNISADDNHKTKICSGSGAELMLKAMRLHSSDARLQEHAIATIAAMCLRSTENSNRLVSLGAVQLIMKAMYTHAGVSSVQRQGCMSIRNLVSRNADLIEPILDAGAENLLRNAGKYQDSVDEAYAALRDLKCEVRRLVVDPTTGKMKDAVEEFGKTKSSFIPVFEASNELENNIDEAVTAPNQSYRF